MRICHVVESMNKGAVEGWLIRTFLHSRTTFPTLDWTFYCTQTDAGRHTEILRSHGANVIASPVPFSQTRSFLSAMRTFLKNQRFDVLHCHHDFLSGFYLWAACGLPIRQRWVHVHNTDESLPTPSRWKHRLLLEPLRQTCLRLSNGIIGIANHVLDQFLRHKLRRANRDVVLYYGLDVSKIRAAELEPSRFRRELALPKDACILLFVGRMSPLKNPVFVVDVLRAALSTRPNTYAVFAGEGDLASAVREHATQLGVENRIRQLGWRDDTAYLMKNSDCFVFPRPEHPMEGLGLVVVESQACGLRMLTTSGISDDAILDEQMVRRIPLASTPDRWAQALNELLKSPVNCNVDIVEHSRFGMDTTTTQLMSLYDSSSF
jgi:glycosyltransferase involved in cell wall biosynthesis